MAEIRRELILADLEKVAKTITKAAGYLTTVRKVDRDFVPIELLNAADLPAVFVNGGPEPMLEFETELDLSLMIVEARLFVEAAKDRSTALNRLIGDVFKAFRVDPTRGGNASDTVLEAIEDADEVNLAPANRVGAMLRWRVEYQHVLGSLE